MRTNDTQVFPIYMSQVTGERTLLIFDRYNPFIDDEDPRIIRLDRSATGQYTVTELEVPPQFLNLELIFPKQKKK